MSVTGQVKSATSGASQRASSALETIGSHMDVAEAYADENVGRAGQTGTVMTVVTIGITALIGILVYSEIDSALPSPDNANLSSSQDSVTEGFGSAMELVPVVLIVLIAAVVLGVVQRMR